MTDQEVFTAPIDDEVVDMENIMEAAEGDNPDDSPITHEPYPVGNGTVVLPLVLQDIKDKAEFGKIKYGTYLRAHNGRDALRDAYQEAIDLCMYLRQKIQEEDERDGEDLRGTTC